MEGNLALLAVALMYGHRSRGQSYEDWERDYQRMQAFADFSGWLVPFRRLHDWLVLRRLRRAYGSPLIDGPRDGSTHADAGRPLALGRPARLAPVGGAEPR